MPTASNFTFVLPPDKYDEFVALLDAPVEPSPKLVALFARPNRLAGEPDLRHTADHDH